MITTIKIFLKGLLALYLKIVATIPSHFIRRIFYYFVGFKIPKKTVVYSGLEIRSPHKVKIQSNTIIGHDCILDGRNTITIGANVNLSSGVWIWTLQHDPQSSSFETTGGAVIIHDYAWISCRTVILPNVTIGEGAVVAAGAVVTSDVEPYSIVGGIPAKKIGERTKDLNYSLGNDKIPFV
ncbi:MAG: acyltransferase [Candidatus Paceibacterota bacterium]